MASIMMVGVRVLPLSMGVPDCESPGEFVAAVVLVVESAEDWELFELCESDEDEDEVLVEFELPLAPLGGWLVPSLPDWLWPFAVGCEAEFWLLPGFGAEDCGEEDDSLPAEPVACCKWLPKEPCAEADGATGPVTAGPTEAADMSALTCTTAQSLDERSDDDSTRLAAHPGRHWL